MRSELVYSAANQMSNRFLLASTVIRAVKKLHIPSTRTEDTTNRVLGDVANGAYLPESLPVVVAPTAMEPALLSPAV